MSEENRRVAIVTGRSADELAAASDISESLSGQGFTTTIIEMDGDFLTRLIEATPDVVFNAVGRSNDGRLQGVCEALGLAYTHSGIATSALSADRHLSKLVFKSAGIPVTDHVLVNRAEAGSTHVLPPPYIAKSRFAGKGGKPVIVRHQEDLPPADLLSGQWADSDEVMVERLITGMTLSAFVMGDVLIGMAARTDEHKNSVAEILIPAPVSPKIYEDGTRLALKAHGVLGCRGVTALTLRFNVQQGFSEPVAIGLDTQPELCRTSPLAQVAARAGHEFDELLRWIVGDASCKRGG